MKSVVFGLFCLFFFVTSPPRVRGEPDTCNGQAVPVSGTNTKVVVDGKPTSDCIWTWSNVSANLVTIEIEEMTLDPKDTISLIDNSSTVIATFKYVNYPGIFFAEITGNKSFTLKIHPDLNSQVIRTATLKVRQHNSTTLQPFQMQVKYLDNFLIPLNAPQPKPLVFDLIVNLKLQSKTLVKVVHSEDTGFQLNGAASDVLGDAGTNAVLKYNKFDTTKSSYIVLAAEPVDPTCSQVYSLDKPTNIVFDPPGSNEVVRSCVAVVKSNDNVLFNVSTIDSLHGPADTLTAYNGSNVNSDIGFQIDSSDLKDEKYSLGNKLLGNNVILVYRGSYVKNPSHIQISAVPVKKSKVDVTSSVTIDGTDSNDNIFLFNSPANRTAFSINGSPVAPVNTNFYCHDHLNSAPFLTVAKGNVLPQTVYSPTNFLRIEAVGGTSYTGTFSTVSTKSTTICEDAGSVILRDSEVAANGSVSWLIPARPGKILLLKVSILALNNKGGRFTIDQLGDKSKTLLNEVYNASVQTAFLPMIRLNGTFNHLFTFSRGNPSSQSGNNLLAFSIAFDAPQLSSVVEVTDETIISPTSYPDSLAYLSSDIGPGGDGSLYWAAKSSAFIYATFEDLDLKGNQQLDVYAPQRMTIKDTLPGDILVTPNITMSISSVLPDTNARTLSGRGFKVKLDYVPCGGQVEYPTNLSIATPGYPAAFNQSDCIWIVKGPAKNLLQMNVAFGSGDNTTVNLTIVDNDSIRGNFFVNTSRLNETLISSKDVVIIRYQLLDPKKPGPGLNITFAKTDCDTLYKEHNSSTARTCYSDSSRCINPVWLCNGINECHDWSDEFHCNSSSPVGPSPGPSPSGGGKGGGVNGWVIAFIIIPLSVLVGYVMHMYGPRVLSRFRGSRSYSEFSNLAEDT